MPTRSLLITSILFACDIPDPYTAPAPMLDETTSGAHHDFDMRVETTSDAESSTSSSAPADDTSVGTTGTNDELSTDTTNANTTDTGDDVSSSSTGEPCRVKVDILISLDMSAQMHFALDRLSKDIPGLGAMLRARDLDVAWRLIVWGDMLTPLDDLTTWTGTPDEIAAATAVAWWGGATGDFQPDFSGANNEPADAGLEALAFAASANAGWREGAARVVVQVTDSALAEAPAVLSGYPVVAVYSDVGAALQGADVRAVVWALAATPGYDAPYGDQQALPVTAHDVAVEMAWSEVPPTYAQAIDAFVAEALDTADGCG